MPSAVDGYDQGRNNRQLNVKLCRCIGVFWGSEFQVSGRFFVLTKRDFLKVKSNVCIQACF